VSFDLDGTLLDTSEGIVQSVKYTVGEMGLQLPSDTNMDFFIGPPIQMSLQKFFGLDAETAQKGADIFRAYYKSEALYMANPYKGVFEMLDELRKKHLKIGVATYKREDYALDILRHFHIAEYCDVMCGADNRNVLKKSDIIQNSLTAVGVKPEETVYVGDTEHDAKGAQEVGVAFIAVTWGFGFTNDTVCSPNSIKISSPIELYRQLLLF
jgi:phosphoglycolate phosphatase